jgi:type II secretion system protein G
MRNKKGFTRIELMIVVVIIGILAALAIPRFMAASKKAKISEAKGVLKQIYTAAEAYYQENGQYPPAHSGGAGAGFNNAATKNDSWTPIGGLVVDRPSGYPRFSYWVQTGGTDGFEARASSTDSYDKSLADVSVMVINANGQLSGGE